MPVFCLYGLLTMVNEVTEANMRTNAFKSIFTIINNYKVTGTTVYAGFPNKNPSFPCYVVEPVLANASDITVRHIQEYVLEVEVQFFCLAEDDRKSKIDDMKDNLMNTFVTYVTTLEAQKITLAEDWFNDDMIDTIEINGEKFHTGSVTLRFTLY